MQAVPRARKPRLRCACRPCSRCGARSRPRKGRTGAESTRFCRAIPSTIAPHGAQRENTAESSLCTRRRRSNTDSLRPSAWSEWHDRRVRPARAGASSRPESCSVSEFGPDAARGRRCSTSACCSEHASSRGLARNPYPSRLRTRTLEIGHESACRAARFPCLRDSRAVPRSRPGSALARLGPRVQSPVDLPPARQQPGARHHDRLLRVGRGFPAAPACERAGRGARVELDPVAVLARVVQDVRERDARLSRGFQRARVMTAVEDRTRALPVPVQRPRDPHAQSVDAAREAIGVLGLADQVDVIVLRRMVHDLEARARSAGFDRAPQDGVGPRRAEAGKTAPQPQRDMDGETLRERGSRDVRYSRAGGAGLAAGPCAPSTVAEEPQLLELLLRGHPQGRTNRATRGCKTRRTRGASSWSSRS